jgi:hypothetical protein
MSRSPTRGPQSRSQVFTAPQYEGAGSLNSLLPNLQHMRSGHSNSVSDLPLLTDGRGNHNTSAYVLRGGFKMPRPVKTAFAVENSDINSMY